jgi:hypothetical protein
LIKNEKGLERYNRLVVKGLTELERKNKKTEHEEI